MQGAEHRHSCKVGHGGETQARRPESTQSRPFQAKVQPVKRNSRGSGSQSKAKRNLGTGAAVQAALVCEGNSDSRREHSRTSGKLHLRVSGGPWSSQKKKSGAQTRGLGVTSKQETQVALIGARAGEKRLRKEVKGNPAQGRPNDQSHSWCPGSTQ